MKTLYTFIIAALLTVPAYAQVFINAFKIQSSGNDRGRCITTDNAGHVITAGNFSDQADFDPSAASAFLSPGGTSTSDVYIAKYDAGLNYIWAIKLGSSQNDYPYAIATDASNNILVAGDFEGTMLLNSTFTPSSTLNSAGSTDRSGFIAKYDSNGSLVWGISIGGVNKDVIYGVKTDAANNVYVTGYFSSTVDFDPSPATYTLASNGGRDIFLAKYDPSGKFVWAFNTGGIMNVSYEEGGQDLAIIGNKIYLTGNFEGTADFDPKTGISNLTSNGSLDIFVAKYDTAGNYIWALNAGSANKHDYSYGIDVDAAENVYITGGFEESVDFDPSASTATLVSASVSAQDIFVAKYNSSGSYQWAFRVGGSSAVDDHAFDIEVTSAGEVYITGEFWGPADFDPSAGTAVINTSNDQIFFAKYSNAGNFVWAFEVGSTSGNGSADNGFGVHLANNGTLYVTGDFSGTADFDPGMAVNTLSVNNVGHAFVAAYSPALYVGINPIESEGSSFMIYPNPGNGQLSVTHNNYNEQCWRFEIIDLAGKSLFHLENIQDQTIRINTESFAAGLYLYKITTDKAVITDKLFIH